MGDGHAPKSDGQERRDYLVRLVMACRGKTVSFGHNGDRQMVIDGVYPDTDGDSLLDGFGVAAFGHVPDTGSAVSISAAAYEGQMRDMLSDDWEADSMPTVEELVADQARRRWELMPVIEACIGRRILVNGSDLWVIDTVLPKAGSKCLLVHAIERDGTTGQTWMLADPLQYEGELREIYEGQSR